MGKGRGTATTIDAPIGVDRQPVGTVQWVDRDLLHANDYNPNRVAPPELRLLKISLLSDGWTQPIVARTSNEIVDGFHRWTVSADPDIAAMTGGKVPVVYLRDDTPLEHQMMSTVRHNRARGTHHVVKMADIVIALRDGGMSEHEIGELMQMEDEEVHRFLIQGDMLEQAHQRTNGQFGAGWTVKPNER